MPALFDRVRETCSAPGTGAVTLLGAVTGYQAFGSVLSSGQSVTYCVADQAGGNWEVGTATYTSSGNTLTRSAGGVLSGSSGAGVLVNFASGTQDVFLDLPAAQTLTPAQLTPPNLLYNADFRRRPRQGSWGIPAVIGTGGYGPLGWFNINQGSVVFNVFGATGTVGNQVALKNTNSSTNSGIVLAQIVESNGPNGVAAAAYRGLPVTVTVTAAASAGTAMTLGMAVLCWNGGANSSTMKNSPAFVASWSGNSPVFGTTNFTQIAYGTVALPVSPSTVQLTATGTVTAGCNNIVVVFYPVGGCPPTQTLYLSQPALYGGVSVPPAAWYPHPADDLICSRFAISLHDQLLAGTGSRWPGIFRSDGTILVPVPTTPPMRGISPTLQTSSPSWSNTQTAGNNVSAYNHKTGAFLGIAGAPQLSLSSSTSPGVDLIITPAAGAPGPALVNGNAGTTSTTATPINLPSGYAAGNLLVIAVTSGVTFSTPSGWTAVSGMPTAQTSTSGGTSHLYVWYKVAGGSEGSSASVAASIGSSDFAAVSFAIAGGTAVETVSSGYTGTGNVSSAAIPGVTPSATNRGLVTLAAWDDGNGNGTTTTITVPTGETATPNNSSGVNTGATLRGGFEALSSASATGTRTYSQGTTNGGWNVMATMFTITPSGSPAFSGASAGDPLEVQFGYGAAVALSLEI